MSPTTSFGEFCVLPTCLPACHVWELILPQSLDLADHSADRGHSEQFVDIHAYDWYQSEVSSFIYLLSSRTSYATSFLDCYYKFDEGIVLERCLCHLRTGRIQHGDALPDGTSVVWALALRRRGLEFGPRLDHWGYQFGVEDCDGDSGHRRVES